MGLIDTAPFRYGNILDKLFVFQHNRAKVKVTVVVRRIFFHCSGLLIFRLIINLTSHKSFV